MVSPYLIRPLRSLCEALKIGLAAPQRRLDLPMAQPSGARPEGGPLGGSEVQAAGQEMAKTP